MKVLHRDLILVVTLYAFWQATLCITKSTQFFSEPQYALIFLILSLELRIIFQYFVDILLHQKTKQEFICCIDNAKLHLKAVLELGYKEILIS